MACRPKLPTGEKKTPKFQAPIYYPTDDPEQLQRLLGQAFGGVEDDLAALHRLVDTPPQTQPVTAVSGTVMGKANDVLRLMPGASGIQVLLPTARSANKGDDVSIIIVAGATGTVTVRAVEGKVQNAASVTLTGGGLRVFRSDGGDGTATGAGGWWIVGKNSADSSAILQAISAGTQLGSTGTIAFANSNGVSFGMNASSQITASVANDIGLLSHIGGNSVTNATRLAFSNASGVTWSLSTAASAATLLASANDQSLAVVSHIGGNVQSSVTRLAFSNASNVTWSLSTAASAVTVLASVNSSLTAINISAGTTNTNASNFSFANGSNVSWGINGSTITASVASSLTNIAISAGTTSGLLSSLVFSNSSNMSFGLNGSTITGQPFFNVTGANGSSVNATVLVFTTGVNNVGFAVSTAASGATVRAAASISFSAGTTNAAASQLSFSDLNGISWGLNGSTITGSYARELGLVSHIGGNVVSSVTRLAFSNASNVTWSLSTAANAATVLASVGAGGGGGVAIADDIAVTLTSGTALFGKGEAGISAALSAALINNVRFSFNSGASTTNMLAFAVIRVSDNLNDTATAGLGVSKLNFLNSNGITFGVSTTSNGDGRCANITAKHADLTMWNNFPDKDDIPADNISNLQSSFPVFPVEAYPFPGNMTLGTLDLFVSGGTFSSTQCTNAWGCTFRGGLYSLNNSTQLTLINSWSSTLSSTTINSTASSSRNNVFGGVRVWSVHSSLWSAQPVLSMGVQYWMAINLSVSGASNPYVNWLRKRPLLPGIQGFVGDSSTIAIGSRLMPFLGHISTGSPPNSIGSANMLSNSAGSAGNIPIVQFKTGISA